MFEGKLTIAPHDAELIEELRHYHRDENFKIVKQRDDLVSALRYAIMMRRSGKAREECEGVGFGNMPFASQCANRAHEASVAKNVDPASPTMPRSAFRVGLALSVLLLRIVGKQRLGSFGRVIFL
jgi:hypothetical protein